MPPRNARTVVFFGYELTVAEVAGCLSTCPQVVRDALSRGEDIEKWSGGYLAGRVARRAREAALRSWGVSNQRLMNERSLRKGAGDAVR
jgi:hypothetical protein